MVTVLPSALLLFGDSVTLSQGLDGSIQINDMLNGDIETICRNIMWNQRDLPNLKVQISAVNRK